MANHDKPFPWGCTCRQDLVMPDGPTLTCRYCGTEWSNSYDEEGKYGRPAKLAADLADLTAKHKWLLEAAKIGLLQLKCELASDPVNGQCEMAIKVLKEAISNSEGQG